MGKLHELLAVEGDLKAEAQRDMNRLKGLFTEGQVRFIGQIRAYEPLEVGGEEFEDEITNLATTVDAELTSVKRAFSAWADAAVQKEVTNQGTNADIAVDGEPLLEGLPATALLNLEGKLAELRQVYAAIPTNDPTERWTFDRQLGCYVSQERKTYRTKKVPRAHVLYEATPEHPAQVEAFTEDVRVGTWTTVIQSGMLTPAEKQKRLKRIDALIRAVRKARQRANDIDVMDVHVADKLFAYIDGE